MSPIVSRATCSIVTMAARLPAGLRSCSSRAAPACMRITLIACPAESCSSRAIRVRSVAAASCRACSTSDASRWARSRLRSPAIQIPANTASQASSSVPMSQIRIPWAAYASATAGTNAYTATIAQRLLYATASAYAATTAATGASSG